MIDSSRISIIDRVNGNVLMRGNCPVDRNGQFAYNEILKSVDLGFIPKKFMTVSLMDNTGERSSWGVDFKAYSVNQDDYPISSWPPYVHISNWDPKRSLGTVLQYGSGSIPGSLYWWPIEGFSSGDPKTFLYSPGWDFSGCVRLLKDLLTVNKDALIYIHCMLGADRTGAAHAGYLISKGMDLQTALLTAENSNSAGMPSYPYVNLVTKYSGE